MVRGMNGLAVILALTLVMCAKVSFAQIGFSNQIPTGADRAPFHADNIRCESWTNPQTNEHFLICLQINYNFDSPNSGVGNRSTISYYDFQYNRWVDSIQIKPLQPSGGQNFITGFGIVNNVMYIIQNNVCNQLLTFDLLQKTYSSITLGTPLNLTFCATNNIAVTGGATTIYILAGDLGTACSGSILSLDVTVGNPTPVILNANNPNNASIYVCDAAIVIVDDTLYLYGGYDYEVIGGNTVGVVRSNFSSLDLGTNTWTPLATGPTNMLSGSIVYNAPDSDTLLISGGFSDSAQQTPVVSIYGYSRSGANSGQWIDLTVDNGQVFNQVRDAATFFNADFDTGATGGYRIGLFRNPSALFALGTFFTADNKRGYSPRMLMERNGGDYGDNSTGDATVTVPVGFLFSTRTGAPYYTYPLQDSSSVLYMNGRNSRSQLLPENGANNALDINVATFTECDSSGAPLTGANALSVNFPLVNYLIDDTRDASSGVQSYVFTNTLLVRNTNVTVTITMSYYEQGQTITSAGVSFYEAPNSVKSTIAVSSWPFASASNTLQLQINLAATKTADSSSALKLIKKELSDDQAGLQVYTYTYAGLTSTVRLLKYAEIDSSNTAVALTFADDYVSVLFPHYSSSLVYDPDFGATLNVEGGAGGDGSSSDNIVYLAFLSVLALVPIVIVVIVVVIIAVFILKHYLRSGAGDNAFDVDAI